MPQSEKHSSQSGLVANVRDVGTTFVELRDRVTNNCATFVNISGRMPNNVKHRQNEESRELWRPLMGYSWLQDLGCFFGAKA